MSDGDLNSIRGLSPPTPPSHPPAWIYHHSQPPVPPLPIPVTHMHQHPQQYQPHLLPRQHYHASLHTQAHGSASRLQHHPTRQQQQGHRQQIMAAHNHDVLCGRGVHIAQHPGNERFRALVNTCFDEAYCNTYTMTEKRAVAESIIAHIKALDPPGKFMKRYGRSTNTRGLEGPWEELSQREAIKKTCQALRDCNRQDRTGYASAVAVPDDVRRIAELKNQTGLTNKQRAELAAAAASKKAYEAVEMQDKRPCDEIDFQIQAHNPDTRSSAISPSIESAAEWLKKQRTSAVASSTPMCASSTPTTTAITTASTTSSSAVRMQRSSSPLSTSQLPPSSPTSQQFYHHHLTLTDSPPIASNPAMYHQNTFLAYGGNTPNASHSGGSSISFVVSDLHYQHHLNSHVPAAAADLDHLQLAAEAAVALMDEDVDGNEQIFSSMSPSYRDYTLSRCIDGGDALNHHHHPPPSPTPLREYPSSVNDDAHHTQDPSLTFG